MLTHSPSRPFLKWAGNKFSLLSRIAGVLPPGKRLLEPFVGAGAVFLNMEYDEYVIGDANKDLMALYEDIAGQTDALITEARALFAADSNQRDVYLRLRSEFNQSESSLRKSALFLYLNRHCFNGLCRYNRKGEFNVPFGRYTAPYFPERELRSAATRLGRAVIVAGDYQTVFATAGAGDIVYADPPYAALSPTANFSSYAAQGFSALDQAALAEEARAAAKRGATVVVSNHDTPFVRELYAGAALSSFDVPRFISCKSTNRKPVREVLAVFRPVSTAVAA